MVLTAISRTCVAIIATAYILFTIRPVYTVSGGKIAKVLCTRRVIITATASGCGAVYSIGTSPANTFIYSAGSIVVAISHLITAIEDRIMAAYAALAIVVRTAVTVIAISKRVMAATVGTAAAICRTCIEILADGEDV
jgi:hypothetical protein